MSKTAPLDEELLSFIDEIADSVETIEVMVLLAADTQSWLDASRVAEHLKTSERSAASRLAHLALAGIAANRGPFYRYAPSSEERGALSLRLLRAYRSHRARVIEAVANRLADED